MVRILTFMGQLLHHIDNRPDHRDRHDAGRVNSAWRWFSARTARRAELYRDLTWRHVGRHLIAALAIILVSRLVATEPYGPLLVIIGALWAAALLRIAVIKGVDHYTRRAGDTA
jgi:hypothetical protein